MNSQEARNRKIIDAVIRKEQAELFGEEDYRRAEKELKEARCCYADAMTAEELNEVAGARAVQFTLREMQSRC